MTHQTYFKDMRDHMQAEMLAEFSGKTGKKQLLIDLQKEKIRLENRPLPGQIKMEEGKEGEAYRITRKVTHGTRKTGASSKCMER